MSRFRTDLRSFPRRNSNISTKFPPVQNDHVYSSLSPSPQSWATDMVVGLQMKAGAPPKDVKVRRAVTSPKANIRNLINSTPRKTAPNTQSSATMQNQLDKLNQEITMLKIQLQELLDKIAKLEKENEVCIALKCPFSMGCLTDFQLEIYHK